MEDTLLTSKPLSTIKAWLGTGSINIFGLPFAGKDTHGAILSQLFDAPLLGGGDILRNSVIPPELKKGLDAGILFPTEEYLRIVTPYLSKPEFQSRPLILSSVGRWIGEEQGVIQRRTQRRRDKPIGSNPGNFFLRPIVNLLRHISRFSLVGIRLKSHRIRVFTDDLRPKVGSAQLFVCIPVDISDIEHQNCLLGVDRLRNDEFGTP